MVVKDDESPKIPGTNYTAEDVAVLALELQDATDDMNDAIRQWEADLAARGFGSAEVPIEPFEKRAGGIMKTISSHRLRWGGKYLVYIDDVATRLLTAPRGARIRALKALPALIAELTR